MIFRTKNMYLTIQYNFIRLLNLDQNINIHTNTSVKEIFICPKWIYVIRNKISIEQSIAVLKNNR